MDPVVVPARVPLRVPVPDLVLAVAHDHAPVPGLEAKVAAAQDLVDVPRASLALPESLVPSPGLARAVTVRNRVISLTIVIAPSLATNRSNATDVTVVTGTRPNLVPAPSQWPSRITDPGLDPNLAASPGISPDRVHTPDPYLAAGVRVLQADLMKRM